MHRLNVLIVDDNKEQINFLSSRLRMHGISFDVETSPVHGYYISQKNTYHIIFLDNIFTSSHLLGCEFWANVYDVHGDASYIVGICDTDGEEAGFRRSGSKHVLRTPLTFEAIDEILLDVKRHFFPELTAIT